MLTLKGNNMAVQLDTMEGIVEHGARIFESVEKDLDKLHENILKMQKVLDAAGSLLMIGGLEKGLLKGQMKEAAGHIGAATRIVFEAHRRCTDIAIKHGVDIPVAMDGGR